MGNPGMRFPGNFASLWEIFMTNLVCTVLFYPAVFGMGDLRTDNHSGTHIDKQPYFVAR